MVSYSAQIRNLTFVPEGRKEIFKQDSLSVKSKDVQQLNPASLPYQLNLQPKMAQALKNLLYGLQSMNIPKPHQLQEEKKKRKA